MGALINHDTSDDTLAKIIQIFFLICMLGQANALTIDEAVALTLKNNFDIEAARLDRRSQKFNVKVSKDAFKWQNSITGESTLMDASSSEVVQSSSSITPVSSIQTKYGTEFIFQPHFHLDSGLDPEITVKQNLLRGFNPDVNLADLRNTIDQNEIDKINFKNTISKAISDTVTVYIEIINIDHKIRSIKRTLKINRENLEQTKIKFQFGEAAKTDVINKRVSVASSLSDLSTSQSERARKINDLLSLMNVKGTEIVVEDQLIELSKSISIPSYEKTQKGLLTNNLDYLNLKLTLVKNKRSLVKVKDALKIGLSLIGTTNPKDISESNLKVALDAPIHDINKEQAVVNAKVEIQKSEAAINNKRIELNNRAYDYIQELKLLDKSIKEQKKELDLRLNIVSTNQERFKRGYISSFELSEQINEKEEAVDKYNELISQFANKAITLYHEMGLTLDRWHVQLPKDY